MILHSVWGKLGSVTEQYVASLRYKGNSITRAHILIVHIHRPSQWSKICSAHFMSGDEQLQVKYSCYVGVFPHDMSICHCTIKNRRGSIFKLLSWFCFLLSKRFNQQLGKESSKIWPFTATGQAYTSFCETQIVKRMYSVWRITV